MTSLASAVRTTLLPLSDVTRLASLRRCTSLFTQGQPADAIFFIDEGIVKLTKTNAGGDRIIVSMVGSGELVGEEALALDLLPYQVDAEVITTATLFKIPRETIARCAAADSQISSLLIDDLVQGRLRMARKVELLCLHDVEFRILHYLAELTSLVRSEENDGSFALPITQAELADLIGATRETTSTTLNQLERKGLVKLSRRLLTVLSPTQLRTASSIIGGSESVAAKSA